MTTPAPAARPCRFAAVWAVIVAVAFVVSIIVNAPHLADLVPHAAPVAAVNAPVAAGEPMAAPSGTVAPLARHLDVRPGHDAAGEPWCPAGWALVDTEHADRGDGGVVCRAVTITA